MLKNPVLEAKGIWKGYEEPNGSYNWVLKGLNLKLLEGDFISILGRPATGKSTLLKIMSFLELPDKGEVYFQGRLVGKSGAEELDQMRRERIWLIENYISADQLTASIGGKLSAMLLDEPNGLLKHKPGNSLFKNIGYLNSRGIAVLAATSDPVAASRAPSIYKLSGGKIVKIAGSTDR